MNEIDAFREVDFDWAVALAEVWEESPYDIPAIHASIRREFARELGKMRSNKNPKSPLGWVVVGTGGTGKTHLLGAFRREATAQDATFIQVDMTGVRDFWDTVLYSYVSSLQQKVGAEFQWEGLLRRVIAKLGPDRPASQILNLLAQKRIENLPSSMEKIINALRQIDRSQLQAHHNVARALLCLNSEDNAIYHVGHTWLLGQAIEDDDRKRLGFTLPLEQPIRIIAGLSWLLSLGGPTVLALDQLDSIVNQNHHMRQVGDRGEGQAAAEAIIAEVCGGLGSLPNTTRRTLVVVACIESTWEQLKSAALTHAIGKYLPPFHLSAQATADQARMMVTSRLAQGYRRAGFVPPYPSWPFREAAFDDLRLDNPREILQNCANHRQSCINLDEVREISRFSLEAPIVPPPPSDEKLDRKLAEFAGEVDPQWYFEDKQANERLAPLLQSALACLLKERPLRDRISGYVEVGFTGGKATKPIHARLRLVHEAEDDREEHYCVRALEDTHARAFQCRLKVAMIHSGIDHKLPFRHLSILRRAPNPRGPVSEGMIGEFRAAKGEFVSPTDEELRTLAALHRLRRLDDPEFEGWLRARRPLGHLRLMKALVPYPHFFEDLDVQQLSTASDPSVPNVGGKNLTPDPEVEPTRFEPTQGEGFVPVIVPNPKPPRIPDPPESGSPATKDTPFPVGRGWVGNKSGDDLTMPVDLLSRHTFIVAGAGAGKTVLVRRLVEEAAILGVPTLVIDAARDLTTLDERWKEPPDSWRPEDHERAERYHERLDYVLWTPGREQGNPIAFEPLPDLSAVADNSTELTEAIEMASAALAPYVAKGGTAVAVKKRGILSSTLRFFAKQGAGRLDDLIAILDDLPAGAGLGVAKEADLASQMADALKVAIETNPMLQSAGAKLDPSLLFGPSRGAKTRVSVISLLGLASDEAQQAFVNQLAMTLFGWIKRNPDPSPRPLRGLLVIDEAKDLVPAVKATACKESLQKLAAQGRKYHLGLIFATQNPKDVDNKIVGNCSTHFYGKANSPNAIDLIRELIQVRGGSGNDVPQLPLGRFYFYNSDSGHSIPTKIEVPLCLSRHPKDTPDEAAILRKAADCRLRLGLNAGPGADAGNP